MADHDAQQLLPAYLVVGTDELKREAVIARLQKRIAAQGDLSLNHDRFDGESASGAQIVAACNTMPFLSDTRLVQVAHVEKLKKADQEELVAYLQAPHDTTVLALVAASLAKNTRLYKAAQAIGSKAIIDCAPVKRRELPALVKNMASSRGVRLTDAGAATLIDLVGENTVALEAQVVKIALAHAGGASVGPSDVAALVSRLAEAKPWEFVDAFSRRDVPACVALRARMESTSPYALLAMCVARIRELLTAQSLAARGQADQLAAYLKLPDWRVKNHLGWARGFTGGELVSALEAARDAEAAMKSGTDPEEAFERWYLGVAAAAPDCA